MRFLLDTHVLLWASGDLERLSEEIQILLLDKETELIFSSVNLWEIAIKRGLGRTNFQTDPRLLYRGLIENGYRELPVTS